MADSSFSPHRVFIVNGQPILIQGDSRLNSVNSISADILQQALQDTNTPENIAVIDNSCGNFIPGKQVSLDDSNDDNKEFVAILGDQDTDDSSTIHLTLEQAAELGLHFEVENGEQSSLNPTVSVEDVSTTGNGNFVLSSNQNKILFEGSSNHNPIAQISGSSKLDGSNNYIHQTNHLSTQPQINDGQSQQVTLIPQFINGTMTYTMQLQNQPSNEFLQIKDSPFSLQSSEQCSIMSTTSTVCASDFSLGNLSTSMISLIQPTITTSQVGLVSTNCIEPIMSTGIQSRMNVQSRNSQKLTYILPNTLSLDPTPADLGKISTTSAYQETSLPQVIDSVKKERILTNGSENQKCVLKTISLSNTNDIKNTNTQLNSIKISNPALQEITENTLKPTVSEVQQVKEICRPIPQQKRETKFSSSNKAPIQTKDVTTPSASSPNKSTEPEDTNNIIKVPKTIVASKVVDSLPQEITAAFSRIPIKNDLKKPLGSNANPIQLVQQGQTFHSMQALTSEQLKRIMNVLQQEHIDTAAPSKNILYDAESHTRIIYRVVCPEELYLRKKNDDSVPLKRRGRPKRVRLVNSNQTNGSAEGDGTGEEEQPRKKATFSRTRSGRLSRPPKHMVRDYKRIMKLDGEESDGAYSDYHSDHQEDPVASANLLPGLSMKQKRNISAQFHCPTCSKIYLGFARMSRHFDKYPDHGSTDYLNMLRSSNPDADEHGNIEFNGSGNGMWRGGVKIGRRRGRTKVRGGYPVGCSFDKCNKLKEALDSCEGKEVVAVAGPAVARLLTTWELLLLRIEAIREESRVAALYQELKQLLKKIQQMAGKMFKPLDHQLRQMDRGFTVEVEDELMSKVLEMPCGVYQVSDLELSAQTKISNKPKKMQKEGHGFSASTNHSIFEYKQESPEENSVLEVSDYIPSDSDEEYQEKGTTKRKGSKYTGDNEENQVLSALNIMDKNLSEPRKVENRVTEPFILPSEEIMCDADERDLDSVDEIVSERLQNLTGNQHQDLCKSDVDELMKGFSVLDHRIVSDSVRGRSDLEPADDLMEGFSIASRRSHIVSASTEDLIKSLEHFGSELNHSEERTAFPLPASTDRENFSRVSNVDLDFEVLSREFHSSNR